MKAINKLYKIITQYEEFLFTIRLQYQAVQNSVFEKLRFGCKNKWRKLLQIPNYVTGRVLLKEGPLQLKLLALDWK